MKPDYLIDYDPTTDSLFISDKTLKYYESVTIGDNLIIDLTSDGHIKGFEILDYSHIGKPTKN